MELKSITGILKLGKTIQHALVRSLILTVAVSLSIPAPMVEARSSSVGAGMFSNEVSNPAFTGISEFFYRNDRDDILVPVFVLGAVTKPGLYHVPIKSDLITLLAVSGGTTPEADLASITIKNQQTNDVQELDFSEVVGGTKTTALSLRGNEVVFVKPKEPTISNNTATVVSVIAGVMGIVLSTIIIRRETR